MVPYFWWDLDSKKENSPGFVVYFEMLLLLPQERILKTWHLDTSHPENGLSMKRTNFLRLGTKAFPIVWVDYMKKYHTSTNQYSTSNSYNLCKMFQKRIHPFCCWALFLPSTIPTHLSPLSSSRLGNSNASSMRSKTAASKTDGTLVAKITATWAFSVPVWCKKTDKA